MFDPVRLRVLHQLRLRSLADNSDLASRLGLESSRIDALLVSEAAAGFVVRRSGRMSGWALTVEGRVEGERVLAAELALAGTVADVEDAYRRFTQLNTRLLAVCTDWQTMKVNDVDVPNDHSDPTRDALVMEHLGVLHLDAQPMLEQLGASLERFKVYGPRLGAAHERIIGGETEWLTRSTIDSYHTVWFELHEDLLATLGRRRSDEQARFAGNSGEEK